MTPNGSPMRVLGTRFRAPPHAAPRLHISVTAAASGKHHGHLDESDAPRSLAPVRLPERLDGTRLEHLSASSLDRFWRRPESWRAHYLARVRGPESGDL